MNLYDIVTRKDRALQAVQGAVRPIHRGKPHAYMGARLDPGSRIRLSSADEFTSLKTFPRDLGWRYLIPPDGPAEPSTVSITVREKGASEASRRIAALCSSVSVPSESPPVAPLVSWPIWTGRAGGFDIDIENAGPAPVEIASGAAFNSRAALTEVLKGTGIEVGPGANPFVMAGPDVDVKYLEALPVSEWLSNYDHGAKVQQDRQELWDRYIIGDAQQLDVCEDGALDFVFSSHVFEHFMNPIGVLKNWARRLKPGGAVACVIPDLRYCFDLRQPPSTMNDWLKEESASCWTLSRAKYEKWCKYTAPYNTPDNLIERNYSIHVHYYTPATMLPMVQLLLEQRVFSNYFFNTSPNNKDFGLVLWK
jgi:SAM-dependent methyltransferase